ncbi:MAG TPA: sigma-70 family RNA polymerase sigma factor [Sphingomicrobium sp.]|nr:sigma-70 family RNA polymerase sigma factor [Sphingomicrobium sp.]
MSADEARSTVPPAESPQPTPTPDAGAWERCMDGDRQAFQQLILSHLDELFAAAQRDLRYHVMLRDLRQHDLSPEELVGETLLRAWRDRLRKPASLGIRPWLLGLQFRVLTRIVRQERLLQRLVSTSLEAPAPEPPIYDDDESFWEWFQPDEMVRWEDILSGDAHPDFALDLLDRDVPGLSPLARQVLVLRRVHSLTFAEIASGLRISYERLSQLWREGRTRLSVATRRK